MKISSQPFDKAKCDACGGIIGETISLAGWWRDSQFDIDLCFHCRDEGLVWCYHCHKPHHKNEPHRMRCQKCGFVFSARIDYAGSLCPKCIQDNKGVFTTGPVDDWLE